MKQTTLEPMYAEKAKQRQEATQLQGRNEEGEPIFGGVQMNLTEENKGKARDQAAKTTLPLGSNETRVGVCSFEPTPVEDLPCPVCGYVNIPGLVICWVCGSCLDLHVKRLAEGSQ